MARENEFKFKDTSDKVIKDFEEVIAKTMKKVLLVIEADAKENVPDRVKTGEMRDSIKHMQTQSLGEHIGRVGSNLHYFIYNELGTGDKAENGLGRKDAWSFELPNGDWITTTGLEPHPMIRPAFRNNKKFIEKEFKSSVSVEFDGGKK